MEIDQPDPSQDKPQGRVRQAAARCWAMVLGFRKISDYAVSTAGLTPRQCRDLLAIGDNLPQFPEIVTALSEGRLSWSHARTICTNTDPAEQSTWLDASVSLSAAELQELISEPPEAASPGPKSQETAAPPVVQPARPVPKEQETKMPEAISEEKLQVISLKFTGEQYPLWQSVSEQVHRQGKNLADDILTALSGGAGNSTLTTRIVLLHCPACGRAVLFPTSRSEIAVPKAMLAAGGTAKLENLIVLCSGCHRRLHREEESARAALRRAPE